MAIIGFPYNSQNRDRAIKAEVYRRLLSKYFTTGVFPNPSTQCQVVAGGGMNVTVKKGSANINGLYIELEEDVTIAVNAPDTLDRYDRVVLRNDDNTTVRAPSVVVIKGTPSESPQPPALTRNDTVYDICLANVLVSQMDSKVEDYNIQDTRLDSSLCGIVSATIESIDTTTFYNQIQADLKSFKENEQADFQEWFDTIKGILGTDEAGKLLQMVQANTSRIVTNENDIEELTQSIDNVGSKLNSEISRATQKESELSSRMDTFTSLKEGSTTGDAELIDGRIGYDGTVYDNIGGAIRGQVTELKSDITEYKETEKLHKSVYLESNILLDYVSLTINSGNGGYSVSKLFDIKDVSEGDVLYIHCGEVTNGISDRKLTALAYDINGSYIGNGGYIGSNATNLKYNLPSGTVRVEVRLLLSRNYPIDANVNVTFNDVHVFKNYNSRDIFVKDSALSQIRTTSTHLTYKMPYLNWEKGFFNKELGAVDGTSYYHAKLDVTEGEIYHIKGYAWLSIYPCVFIDDTNTVISFYPTEEKPSITLCDFEVVVPRGATKMYCSAILNYQDGSIGQWDMFNCIVKQKILSDEYAHSKQLIVLGDSWCEKNITANENFIDYLINDGYEVTNLGIGGTGYRRTYDTNNAFYQRALNLPTDKGNNILIFGSFNDLGLSDYTLGDIDSNDLSTVCGCINQTIANIYSVIPLANIMIVTPGPWRYINRKEYDKDKAEAYCNAIVNICKKNHIPVYNFYDDCGLRAWDSAFCNEFYKEGWSTNTTHPNDKGHFYYVYPKIRDFVVKNCN